MTINKSQKQTFEKIAILLGQPVLICTSQQVESRSFNDLRFYISEYNGQGHLANDEILF
jgi:hypothetical protein